ncbi:recombinase RecT [Streptomyces anthocyanicus]
MTELTVHGQPQTALSITDDQATFNDQQVAALRHLGVEGASPADLAVFFHVVKRTGLDPFARQIYMISRKSKGEHKQTIQTGIDGYRLIGRRAANARGETISVGAPEWAREDGQWVPIWSTKWGHPLAARVTINRNGQPFTAVALFDEYKQTKYDGGLTQMWSQRPAGQIAKCAEALAWRMAFPQDLAGVYVEDEMQHADSQATPAPAAGKAAVLGALRPEQPAEDVVDAEVEPAMVTKAQLAALHASLSDIGITDREDGLTYVSEVVGRTIASTKDLTRDEASRVIDQAHSDAAPLPVAELDTANGEQP